MSRIVLQVLGGMTNLRSLQACLVHTGGAQVEHGWVTRLSLLTSLDFSMDGTTGDDSAVFDELVSSVPHLPALRELRLGKRVTRQVRGLADAPFARLVDAAGALEVLHLTLLQLPGGCVDAIRQLTRLTSLSIRTCECAARGFAGLAALTRLRRLELLDVQSDCGVGCNALVGLKQLTMLRLNGAFVTRRYVARLCGELPRLERLDVSGSRNVGSGLSALERLTNLEVVDLSNTVGVGQLAASLRVPPSLRLCLLRGLAVTLEEQHRVEQLLGPRVEVRFNAPFPG
jgi:hypothetical protein